MSCLAIAAGGTGGHIMPALAVAEALRARGLSVVWLGVSGGREAGFAEAAGLPFAGVSLRPWRHSGWTARMLYPSLLSVAAVQAARVLKRHGAAAVLGFGGFASVPGMLGGFLRNLPLLLHEQNAIAGLANRYLAKLGATALGGFAEVEGLTDVRLVGNPVRPDIARVPPPAERLRGREGALRLLVVGGSQGARVFDDRLPEQLGALPQNSITVRHQHGAGRDGEQIAARYRAHGIEAQALAFIDDMAEVYAWADLVICRAGAMTLAELCASGSAAIAVPYPHATDQHQRRNAEHLSRINALEWVSQEDLISGAWLARLRRLIDSPAKRLALADGARRAAQPGAAEHIVAACEEVIGA